MQMSLTVDPGFWMRVVFSVACGAAVGLERQLRGKPAGIRTSVLICLGTSTFVQLGEMLRTQGADATRLVGQVVTGVGFLGAGVILTREGLVKGVTSAAVIWVLAAIGCAVGLDRFGMAVATTAVTIGVLVVVEALERASNTLRRGVHAHPATRSAGDPAARTRRRRSRRGARGPGREAGKPGDDAGGG